jgi:glc operon protein GlcG
MRKHMFAALAGLALALAAAHAAHAQLIDKKTLSLVEAKKIVAAAAADATKSNLTMAIAIVDDGGHLVLFERMDDTQVGSIDVAIRKARSAAFYRRPTKVFEDGVIAGRSVILALDNAMPIEGGLPLMAGGKLVGAIGVSGGTAPQDGVVAAAGAAALGK